MNTQDWSLPDKHPDFDYWIRRDCWTPDQALFLICGLNPPKGDPDPDVRNPDKFFRVMALSILTDRNLVEPLRLASDYLDNAIQAKVFDPERIPPKDFIEWALKKGLPVHDDLLAALELSSTG